MLEHGVAPVLDDEGGTMASYKGAHVQPGLALLGHREGGEAAEDVELGESVLHCDQGAQVVPEEPRQALEEDISCDAQAFV